MISLRALIAWRAHAEFPEFPLVLWPYFPFQFVGIGDILSLDKSRNKYSEVGGTVVLLQRAD